MATNTAMVWKGAQEALMPHAYPAEGVYFPVLIARGDPRARGRFLEFFTVNIRNPNTRAAYGRAAVAFLDWCESHSLVERWSAAARERFLTSAAHGAIMEGQQDA